MNKPEQIMKLHEQLIASAIQTFPLKRKVNVSTLQGVYIIYSPEKNVLHVGRTNGGKNGLDQRLLNHVRNQSSFSKLYLQKKKINLRNGYKFRYIEVHEPKTRGLLEALTAGLLCPAHFGTGEKKRNEKID